MLALRTAEKSSLSPGRRLIDPGTPDATRMAIVREHPQRSAEFLAEMISDLTPGTPEEYRRIPWIWNVTVAAGKRHDAAEMRKLLELSLPLAGAPLHDWQAVVLGGGLINGISLSGLWPKCHFAESTRDPALLQRWEHALELSVVMAENEKVPPGTRYDALRMVALLPWEKSRAPLTRFLPKDQNPELQQGAVSGLADVEHPEAAKMLVDAFTGLADANKKLALDALLRSPERIDVLLIAVEAGKITRSDLGEKRVAVLNALENEKQRAKARMLLPPPK
jgi:hypothetical protein